MHFSFKLIFSVIFLINSVSCYNSPQRSEHNGVIINDRLLILGGWKNQSLNQLTYELFYLDLSKSFDNTNLSWTLIPDGNLPVYSWLSTAIVGLDNSTIFQIGGYMKNKVTLNDDFSHQVYTYDYPTSKWTTPSILGDSIPLRQEMKGVIDNSGIIYIFGGANITNFTASTVIRYNDMNTLDTSSMNWRHLSISENLPLPTSDYSASILPNGVIVYIGGQEVTGLTYHSPVRMKKIKLFDTTKLEWSFMDATGDDVDPRVLFSSVLTPDGYIIIFGGTTPDLTGVVSPDLAVLDTNKSPYEWSIPSSSKFSSPPSIYGHSANLYFNYMIIAFGQNAADQTFNSQVYLYDITSNKWVKSFTPPQKGNPPVDPPPPKNPPKGLVIGLVLGISIAVVMSGVIIFILHRKKRILEIPGTR